MFDEYAGKKQGFVDLSIFKRNEIFEIFYLFLRKSDGVYIRGLIEEEGRDVLYEVTHMYNLFILLLLLDLTIALNICEKGSEEEGDLKVLENDLMGRINGPLRQYVKNNRLTYEDRLYTAFDTEFETKDCKETELLCLTMAVKRTLMLRVKKLEVDYSITNETGESGRTPKVGGLIRTAALLIRFINGKDDPGVERLVNWARTLDQLRVLDVKRGFVIIPNIPLTPESFKTCYIDAEDNDRSKLTIPLLLETSKEITVGTYNKSKELYEGMISECLTGTGPSIREIKNFYLLCHYSAADLCALADLGEIKNKLKILAKSIVTMQGVRVEGCSHALHIRDTSILTPLMPSLKSISELYNHPLLKKLELPGGGISRMKQVKAEDPNLFVQYAMNDAIICLYHGLRMEESNLELTRRYDIPVTLSSIASQYLANKIGGPKYELPTHNGLFNVKDLPRLFTPKGIEMSGGLTEWLGYFLASYKGGRNENYAYGLTEGHIHDLDLKAAYSVGLSLLQYPKYKEIERVTNCKGSDLMAKYGWDLVKSYSAFKVRFAFPQHVRYPNIAVRLGEGSVTFPLIGVGYCTGIELYFAISSLSCEVFVEEGYLIPFLTNKKVNAREEEIGDKALVEGIQRENSQRKQAKACTDFSQLIPAVNQIFKEKTERVKSRVDNTIFKSLKETLSFKWMSLTADMSTREGVMLGGIECKPI